MLCQPSTVQDLLKDGNVDGGLGPSHISHQDSSSDMAADQSCQGCSLVEVQGCVRSIAEASWVIVTGLNADSQVRLIHSIAFEPVSVLWWCLPRKAVEPAGPCI